MGKKISLIIISKNEIEGIKFIGERVNAQKKYLNEIILVDGQSTDGTIEYAKELGWNVIVQSDEEMGIMNGIRIGIENSNSEYVTMFTPDNNCIPEKIEEIHNVLTENITCDMVTVSRYYKDAKSYDDNLVSGFGNWMFTSMVNLLFRANYTDVLGIYRCFRKSLINELGIKLDLLSISTTLCIRCKKRGRKVIDIAGDEPDRVGGQSYRSYIKNGLQELYTILREFIFQKL